MFKSGFMWGLGGLALGAVAAAAMTFVSLRPGGPAREDGLAWTDQVVAQVLGRALYERAPGQVQAMLPGASVDEVRPDACQREVKAARSGFFDRFEISFDAPSGAGCAAARATSVVIDFRKSDGVNAATVFAALRERLGSPEMDTERQGNQFSLKYRWRPLVAMSVSFTTSYDAKAGDTMRLSVSRPAGTAAGVESEDESGAWLDSYIDAVTGPAFRAGHGPGDAAQLGAVRADAARDGKCPVYREGYPNASPFLTVVELELTAPAGGASPAGCEAAPFQRLGAVVWRVGGVTVDRANARFRARLGVPALETGTADRPGFARWNGADGISYTLMGQSGAGVPLFQIAIVRERRGG